jgi:putative ABC transport system permease protein
VLRCLTASVVHDVRYGLRSLRRQPAFAATSILTIAVGAAALALVLSVVHAALGRPIPYPTAPRIVQIEQTKRGRGLTEVSMADVLALRQGSPSLSHVTIAWFSQASVSDGGNPDRARLVYTDAQAFDMLGVRPLLGRLPSAADEAPDGEPVVVIGHGLWSERYSSDPGAIGRTVRIDGLPHVVIGVMPRGFRFPAPYWAAGDFWLLRGPADRRWPRWRQPVALAFGLLKDGRTIDQAQQEASAVASTLDAQYPDPTGPIGLRVTTWAQTVRSKSRPQLLMILGAAAVLFLIVCINVTNLLLASGLDRDRELAARAALGATRTRLVRQMLVETAVLFAIGGIAGTLVAVWGSTWMRLLTIPNLPRMDEAAVDLRVVALTVAIVLMSGVLVGVVPALQGGHAAAGIAGANARWTSRGRRWRRLQRALIAVEVALALVLLCGAGVLLEGAVRLARVRPGFDTHGLLHARVALPPEKYATPAAQSIFYNRVLDRVRAAPDVKAGVVNVPPGTGGDAGPSFLRERDPIPASRLDLRRAKVCVISDGYFETLGLAPRAGRFFSRADDPRLPVAVVNDAFVRQYFDGEIPLGRELRVVLGRERQLDRVPRTIIGVVGDVREAALYRPAPPAIYVPLTQGDSTRSAFIVRSGRPMADVVAAVRSAVAAADADLAAFSFMPLEDLMAAELSLNRLTLWLLAVLAGVSLVLAIVGAYGVVSHASRHRTREIGIRLALGATQAGVQRLLLAEGCLFLAAGLAAGGIAALWGAALLRSLVYGIERTSAMTYTAAGVLLAFAVLAGSYVPARRASRTDPAVTLRAD